MSLEATPSGQEPAAGNSPIELNRQEAGRIIETVQADWQHHIDIDNGSTIHHEAEIEYLRQEGWRVSYLIFAYSIEEPIDTGFVHDVVDFLKASDINKEAYGGLITREDEEEFIDKTLASLRRRNQVLAQEAA